MPYINRRERNVVHPTNPGELNFLISELIENYRWHKTDSYQIFNDIIGALEAQKLEFYRRVVVPYEDAKCRVNGDVYATSVPSNTDN